jgi:hypothetical protein
MGFRLSVIKLIQILLDSECSSFFIGTVMKNLLSSAISPPFLEPFSTEFVLTNLWQGGCCGQDSVVDASTFISRYIAAIRGVKVPLLPI